MRRLCALPCIIRLAKVRTLFRRSAITGSIEAELSTRNTTSVGSVSISMVCWIVQPRTSVVLRHMRQAFAFFVPRLRLAVAEPFGNIVYFLVGPFALIERRVF